MNKQVEIRDQHNAYFGRIANVVEVINHAVAGKLYKVAIGNISFIIKASDTAEVQG